MNIERYLEVRQQLKSHEPQFRTLCTKCLQPGNHCYCQHIKVFDPAIKFVVLTHFLESRKHIATGRMSVLSLKDSELIVGHDYTHNSRVNQILRNKAYHPVILYPGLRSVNLTSMTSDERTSIFPKDKKPLIFVVDGTWNTAKKMVRLSENLRNLPQISFTPTTPSTFRVRKQPKPQCYSTIEAIHQVIDLLGTTSEHGSLLHIFDRFVEKQLTYVALRNPRHRRIRSNKCEF